jgi:hypothetical protein
MGDVASSTEVRQVVERLARALDADDFAAARALLADDCVYQTGSETHHGPDQILASYAAASARAHRDFDEVRYESSVEPVMGATATVTFTDYLLKAGGRWHRHRCRQEFTLGAGGRIARIVHRDFPGEREALEAYLRECGIGR